MTKADNILPQGERTELIYGLEKAISCGVQFLQNVKEKMDILSDHKGPSHIVKYDIYRYRYIEAKKRGVPIRFVTEITNDNVQYCKELRKFVSELRHLDGLKGSISLNESEFIGSTSWSESQLLTPVIYSNVKQVVEQQQYIFNTIWNRAAPAEQRIKEIEEGIEPEVIETTYSSNPDEIQEKIFCLLNSANTEILILFATSNAFHRQTNSGSIEKIKEITKRKPWISIKILTPKDEFIENILDDLYVLNFNIRTIEPISKVSILIVDRKHSLVAELKEDSKKILTEKTVGFVTYSNSPPTVLTYASIFDGLWKQIDMNRRLQIQDKIQKEFINTAAHELRTPIQPIIGMVDLIKKNINSENNVEFLDIISRNAKRLKKLSEDILDSAIIESSSFKLLKEYFDVNQVIIDVLNSFDKEIDKKCIKIEHVIHNNIKIYADKNSITRVISHLISNSIKFNPHGGFIYIEIEKKDIDFAKEDRKEIIIIRIRDSGMGIKEDLLPKLFAKFITTSFQGIGLGLYISKNIIEAHGGKIWAENNSDGIGATFSFCLPINP